MAIQTNYDRDPAIGKPGMIARETPPPHIVVGVTQVDSSERLPRPGDAVIRDNASGVDAYKVPGSSAEQLNIVGIVAHRQQEIPTTNVAGTSTAVQYADGEPIYVITFGLVYVRVNTGAGASVSWGDQMTFATPSAITDDGAWSALSISALTGSSDLAAIRTFLRAQPKVDIIAVNETPVGASTDTIVPVKINMGR